MKDISIVQIFISSPLLSFLFYLLIRSGFKALIKGESKVFNSTTGRIMINLVLICSLVLLCWTLVLSFIDLFKSNGYSRAFGPYWWAFWYYPVILMITQLLWVNRFKQSEGFNFVIGFFLVAQPFFIEKLVIFITSFNRDYLPSHFSSTFSTSVLRRLAISILITTLQVQ